MLVSSSSALRRTCSDSASDAFSASTAHLIESRTRSCEELSHSSMIDSHSVSLSWNSLSAPNTHRSISVSFVIALPLVYGLYRTLSCLDAERPSCDAIFFLMRDPFPLGEHAECVVDLLACHQHLRCEGLVWRWCCIGLLELLKHVCKCRVLLRDTGFELARGVLTSLHLASPASWAFRASCRARTSNYALCLLDFESNWHAPLV